jgi:hypothetical protein
MSRNDEPSHFSGISSSSGGIRATGQSYMRTQISHILTFI